MHSVFWNSWLLFITRVRNSVSRLELHIILSAAQKLSRHVFPFYSYNYSLFQVVYITICHLKKLPTSTTKHYTWWQVFFVTTPPTPWAKKNVTKFNIVCLCVSLCNVQYSFKFYNMWTFNIRPCQCPFSSLMLHNLLVSQFCLIDWFIRSSSKN